MRLIGLSLALLAFALPVAGAQAQDNAAVDEYTETIPGGAGDRPSSEAGRGSSGGSLPPGVVRELEQAGPDGAAAASLAQSTAPPRAEEAGSRAAGRARGDEASGPGGIGAVVEGVVSSGSGSGMGIALPIILAVALIGAVAVALARRRASPGTPA